MKKVLFILLAAAIVVSATACGNAKKEPEPATQPATVAAAATAPVTTEAPQEETSQTEQPQTEETRIEEQPHTEEEPPQEKQNMSLQMTIGSTPVAVSWDDNEAVQALKELCRNQPLTIAMSMYGGFEQVGHLRRRYRPVFRQSDGRILRLQQLGIHPSRTYHRPKRRRHGTAFVKR